MENFGIALIRIGLHKFLPILFLNTW